MYCPIILRERSAGKLSRFWRCAQAKKLARHKRARLRLATLVNPYVRGFLARVATRTVREERYRRQNAMLLVSFGKHATGSSPDERSIPETDTRVPPPCFRFDTLTPQWALFPFG